jgi:uncharacterized protein (DUF2062 family)
VVKAPGSSRPYYRRWWRALALAGRNVVRLQDTPYRVAMGAACGLFASVLPIFGQTFVGMGLAWLLRGNMVASIPWTWLSNPLTIGPIFYVCYQIGAWLTGAETLGWDELQRGLLEDWWGLTKRLFYPLLIGALILGGILAAIGFVAIRALVARVQRRRAERARSWSAALR